MNFSEVLRVSCSSSGSNSSSSSSSVICYSPNGSYIAWPSTPSRLEIKDAKTLQVMISFTCLDAIQEVEWSSDSQYIMTASYKRGVVEVWSMSDTSWRCRINEGTAGLIKARWSPDGRHVLTTAEFYLQITIWSLINKSVCCIRHPKSIPDGAVFSPDGDYLCVAERRDCKDFLSLFETKSWQLVKTFPVCTRDLCGVVWGGTENGSNAGSVLCVWESPTLYRVGIYTLSGVCIKEYKLCDLSLGVRLAAFSPTGQFLAIASLDNKVRLLNHLSWGLIGEYNHHLTITSTSCTVYKENRTLASRFASTLTNHSATAATTTATSLSIPAEKVEYQQQTERPVSIPTTIPTSKTQAPPPPPSTFSTGVTTLRFSPGGRYIATLRGDVSNVVWIYDVAKSVLCSVVIQKSAVKDISWDPKHPRLALCTGGSNLYFWSPLGTLAVNIPGANYMHITSLRWSPDGSSLILSEKKNLVVCMVDGLKGLK